MPSSGPESIAVIGAGVSGCAFVAQLRRLGYTGTLSLLETGRGPGGRASTRRSRQDHGLRIDHGAPLLNITGATEPLLLQPLLAGGWIEPWPGLIAQLQGEATLRPGQADALGLGQLYRGRGGMDHLCKGLLSLAGEAGETTAAFASTSGSEFILAGVQRAKRLLVIRAALRGQGAYSNFTFETGGEIGENYEAYMARLAIRFVF